MTALQSVPALEACGEGTLLDVVGDSVNLHWPAGTRVFARGSQPDGLFIVLAGAVGILGETGNELARLGPGDHFGELSLLRDAARQNDVVAAEDSELMVIPKDRFDRLLAENPELAKRVRQAADERFRTDSGDSPAA